MKHHHYEAFKLMKYRSDDGTVEEYIWNSRDGVTPFVVQSKDKTRFMQHVDWGKDIYDPDYVPVIGERIFMDMTLEHALNHRREFVQTHYERLRKSPVYANMGAEEIAAYLAQQDIEQYLDPQTNTGAPVVIEVTEGVLEWLSEKRITKSN